jgi:hypothetical protein
LLGILVGIHFRLGYVLFVVLVTVDLWYAIMISKCDIVCRSMSALEVNVSTDMKSYTTVGLRLAYRSLY